MDALSESVGCQAPMVIQTWKSTPSVHIQQIDHLAVYHFGGLYYDIAVERTHFFTNRETRLLGNYAFYAPRGHPILWRIVENILRPRIPERQIPNDPVKRVLVKAVGLRSIGCQNLVGSNPTACILFFDTDSSLTRLLSKC